MLTTINIQPREYAERIERLNFLRHMYKESESDDQKSKKKAGKKANKEAGLAKDALKSIKAEARRKKALSKKALRQIKSKSTSLS